MALPAALPPLRLLLPLFWLLPCACAAAGFYAAHPVLLPMLSDIDTLRAHLSPFIFFILLNLLVAALLLMPHGSRKPEPDACTDAAGDGKLNPVAAGDGGHALVHDAVAATTHPEDEDNDAAHRDIYQDPELELHPDSDHATDNRKAQTPPDTLTRGSHRSRNIVRSVSDGVVLMHCPAGQHQRTPLHLRPFTRLLKKASTFESALRRRRVKPVVIIKDPPEEEQAGEDEVDRKAEEFIGRFYQRMKLQR